MFLVSDDAQSFFFQEGNERYHGEAYQVSVELFADIWADLHKAHEDKETAKKNRKAWKMGKVIFHFLELEIIRKFLTF